MSTEAVVVTFAVASVRPAKLARITVDPATAPVTGIVAVVAPPAMDTEAATVAAAGLEEFKVNVRPPDGAAPESVNVRFCDCPPVSESVCGARLIVAVTCTAVDAELISGADAVTFAVPGPTPVICGAVAGCVDPAGIVTVEGVIVTFDASELASMTVVAVERAEGKVTCNGEDWPRATLALAGSPRVPAFCTLTFVVAPVMLGVEEEAVRTTFPTLTPVTGTVTELDPCAMNTDGGNEMTPA